MADIEFPQVDLTNCDREPIHVLGAIQPFGILLAFSPDWLVARVSGNLAQFLDLPFPDVVGIPATNILCPEAIHMIRNLATMLRGRDSVERTFGVPLQDGGPLFDLAIHFSGSLLVVEAEPAFSDRADASAMVRAMMARVRQVQTPREFLQEGARQVRAITGFDRVMVYRFDQTGCGEVVAESRRAGVDSFLGLNYPASDIPVQARALYIRNVFRIIADVEAELVGIRPQRDPAGTPLDLSLSVLRAVSPIHIEYLKNMGVKASLSISIVVEGKLWGLFACHHYTPRLPGFVQRTAAELFGSMFSLMLEGRERAASAEYEGKARKVTDRLMAVLAQDGSQLADAEWLGSVIADAITCDGVGVFVQGQTSLVGLAPDADQFQAIISLLNQNASNQIFTTDCLKTHIPAAADYAGRACGLLAIPISRSPRDYVVLFRSEKLRSVRWAGNPEKPVEYGPNGARLTPRKSFEEWAEIVKGQANPFAVEELRIAESVRGALLEVILRMSDAAGEERRKADERQALLIAELNHRVRNILALIRGLVSQTRETAAKPEEMMRTLELRVQALARAHDQITRDEGTAGSLQQLIEIETGAFLGAKRDRVHLNGTDAILAPAAFTLVALVIHELVTNAAKYGALSGNGSVTIDCRRADSGDIEIRWRESGGPVVTAPTRRGLGATIIERSLPHELGGEAQVRFCVTGIEADFTIPAKYVSTDEKRLTAVRNQEEIHDIMDNPLENMTVLLVEDSLLIAVDCEAMLETLGASVVHTASSVEEAKRILSETSVDFALLDLNLGGENSLPVADILGAERKPFLFATGYGDANILPPDYRDVQVVSKPYTVDDLRRSATNVLPDR